MSRPVEQEHPAPVDADSVCDDEGAPASAKTSKWRIVALFVLLAGLAAGAKLSGITDGIDAESIRAMISSAGVLGFLAFLGIFALGELVHIPGLVFVGAATLAYGQGFGLLASFLGAMASLVVSFVIVRTIGGTPLASFKRPWLVRVFGQLERRPVATVALLRLVFWMAPPLNYALAMSKVRFRDYVVGSALGLVLPIVGVVFLFDWVVAITL